MKTTRSHWILIGAIWLAAPKLEAQTATLAAPIVNATAIETQKIDTQKLDWFDAKRKRVVPAKIHFPKTGAGPFPLLVISHGLGGTRDGLDYLGTFWAAHGYVCAQIQHVGSDESVWRGAGGPQRSQQAMKAATTDSKVINDRPLDVKFAIDEMLRLNRDPKSALFGRINAGKVGAAGHSFGAFTAQAVAGRLADQQPRWRDPRVVASIALSAPANALERSRAQYATFKTPFYLLTGTRDESALGGGGAQYRRVPFDAIQGAEGQLLVLEGADHAAFGGRLRQPSDWPHQSLILSSTLLFWDAYLKGSASAKQELRGGAFAQKLGDQGTFEIK